MSKTTHQIKAILFDLDNTLSDFMLMKEEACKAAVRGMIEAGLDMTENEAYEQLIKTYFELGLESDIAFTEFLTRTGKFSHKLLAAAINSYLKTKAEFVKPYDNVKSVLQRLQESGVFLSIVTDAPKTKAYQRLLAMELEPYFSFVVGFEDTKEKKQTGLPLKLALAMIEKVHPSIKPAEVLMVGDSMERDVYPAKALGLQTALCRYGQRIKEEGSSDYELEDIKELIKLVMCT